MKQLARIVSLVSVLFGAVVLHADTAQPTPPKPLTASEVAVKTATLRAQIATDGRKVVLLRERARKSNDVIKLNCVNDKQIQVKAEMNVADALITSGPDGQSVLVQLASAGDAVQHLREDAEACVGAPDLYKQEQGGVVAAPDIVDDPTQTDPFTGGEVEPPLSASK